MLYRKQSLGAPDGWQLSKVWKTTGQYILFIIFFIFFYKHLIKLFPLRLILPKQDKEHDSQLIEQVCGLR